MGKDNKAQRTKNNAKPSSSGRSAQLLHGQLLTQGQMFTAVKDVPTFTSVGLEDMDSSVDANFQMVLKKMNKKDPTTKLKALQEFTELVKKCEVDVLKTVLPFWPRIYCLLATDSNHRVRESSHLAQLCIVTQAKRNIAPQLKQMIGAWFVAQHDLYAPAACAAQTAFNEAFTGDVKQRQAVEFCQFEILQYIRENILAGTQPGGKSTDSDEDCESRQQRALVSSLQGYTLYLQKLPPEVILAAQAENEAIVNSKQFNKLAKHAVCQVRGSWYSCLAALCVKVPHLLPASASLAVLSSLDDSDATVLPLVWDAALHLVVSTKECWAHVSVDKLVIPKLLATLRNGCHGNAAAILPSVLPFISQLPAVSTTVAFYEKLFSSLRQGFTHKMAVQSQSECNALAKCYVECCRYAILKHQSDDTVCRDIVEKQLVAALALTLTDVRLNLLASPLSAACVSLLLHWDRLECPLLSCFWTALEPIVTQPIDAQTDGWSIARRVDLLLSMKCPREQKSGVRVTFKQDAVAAVRPPTPPTPPSTSPNFSRPLSTLAITLSLLLAPLPQHTPLLARLLTDFSSAEIFTSLSSPHSKIEWFHLVISDWLAARTNEESAVVDIALLLVAWLCDSEAEQVLGALAERCSGTSLAHFLTSCVAAAGSTASVSAFLRHSEVLTSVLTRLAQQAGAEDSAALVLVATSKSSKAELLISDSSLSHLVALACSSPRLDLAVSLVEALSVDQSDTSVDQSALSSLVVALFSACLKGRGLQGPMSRGARKVASRGGTDDLLRQVERAVSSHITAACKSDSSVEVDRCADAVHQLLTALTSDSTTELAALLDHFLSMQSREYDELGARFTQLCDSGIMESHYRHLSAQSNDVVDKSNQSKCLEDKSVQSDETKSIVNKTEIEICEELDLYFFHSLLNAKLMARLFLSPNQNAEIPESSNQSHVYDDEEFGEEIEVFKTRANKREAEDSSANQTEGKETTNENPVEIISSANKETEETIVEPKGYLQAEEVVIEENLNEEVVIEENVNEEVVIEENVNEEVIIEENVNEKVVIEENKNEEVVIEENVKEEFLQKESDDPSNVLLGEMFYVLESHVLRLVSCVALSRSLSTRYATTMLNFASSQRRSAMESTVINMLIAVGSTHIGVFFKRMIHIWEKSWPASVYCSQPVTVQLAASKITMLISDRVSVGQMKEMDQLVVQCWERCPTDSKPYDVLLVIPTRQLLYDSDVWKEETSYVETVASTAQYLSYLVETREEAVSPALWDFIFISTASWMQSVQRSKRWMLIGREHTTSQAWQYSHRSAVMAVNTLKLLQTVTRYLEAKQEQEEGRRRKQEWDEVFLGDIRDIVCRLFMDLCSRESTLSVLSTPVQQQLGLALCCVDVTSYASVDKLTHSCLQALQSRQLIVQYTAFQVLTRLSPTLVKQDAANEEAATPECNLHRVTALLAACSTGVDARLADTRLSDQRDILPHSSHGNEVLGYLLAAHVVMDMCDVAHDSLTSQYALHLRESGLLGQLLHNLLRLMPARVLDSSEARSKTHATSMLFTSEINTSLKQPWTTLTIHHLACRVYWLLLSRLPAEVRAWWCNCDQRTLVERVTTRFVSPALCDLEMQQVRTLAAKQVNKYDNMKVKVHSSVREVTAVYTVDEARMELVIALPSNHPLGLVKIETPRNVVSSTQARTWLMQLTMFLTCQNGSLWNGLSLWKSNLDKCFEGIEECYICFSVLSGSNFQLPRVCCRTCKKKFHSGCLFKWFSTSNKSSCPVCRNMF